MFKKTRSLHSRLLRLEKLCEKIQKQQSIFYQKYYGRVIRRRKADEEMLRKAKYWAEKFNKLQKRLPLDSKDFIPMVVNKWEFRKQFFDALKQARKPI